MKQVDIYKESLKVMEEARVVRDDFGIPYWEYNEEEFAGLCTLLRVVLLVDSYSLGQFTLDSKKVLGVKSLSRLKFWFTCIDDCEPKARQERINHLENLIKLYEDGAGRDI